MSRTPLPRWLPWALVGALFFSVSMFANRWIAPVETDPGMIDPDAPHYVVPPTGLQRGQLFVFFPGSGAIPANYTEIVEHAASLGYHAVGLSYVNDLSINFDLCRLSEDPACHANVRREIKEGVDVSRDITVDPVDSIDNRLLRLLQYLHNLYPDEGWNQFLRPNGTIAWPKLAVAGHSQGGGHAGFIAKNHAVARCLVFAGADVVFGEGCPASWLEWPPATPASRVYGFTHALDLAPSLETSRKMWTAYGLDDFGLETIVEDRADLAGQHRLITFLEPADPANYHGAPVVDFALPRGPDNENLLLDTWTHLLTDLRPTPGERVTPLETDNERWVSPGFDAADSWMTWQDTARRLWVGRFDPATGLLERDATWETLDTGLSTVAESRKGPEFITWQNGSLLAYVKFNNGIQAIHGATRNLGRWTTTRLSPQDGLARGGMIGTASPAWSRPATTYWRGSGNQGQLCWTWLDEPWQDRVLGPVLSGSTPARFAPDGRHLLYTIEVNGTPQIFLLEPSTGKNTQLTSLPEGIVNPLAFLHQQSGNLIVGGVVHGRTIHLYEVLPGPELILLQVLSPPDVDLPEGYDQFGSPEAFTYAGRALLSVEVIRGEPGGVPDARIWLLEAMNDENPLHLRVDDGAPDTRRADPEYFFGTDDVFLTYQKREPGRGVRQIRVRTGLALFTQTNPLQIECDPASITLRWADAAEPRLYHSGNLVDWAPLPQTRSPFTLPLEESRQFFQLVPAQGPPLPGNK